MTPETIKIVLFAVVATGFAAFLGRTSLLFSDLIDLRRRRIARVREIIARKIAADIIITAKDVVDIGRGAGEPPGISTDALYELFAMSDEPETHTHIRALIDELNREEPFEALPDISRPSMARLAMLCEESSQHSDKELLQPIRKLLEEYQEMKRDHARIKRQSRISYVVALISFFIGVLGLILAFRGPSKDYISNELSTISNSIVQHINAQQSGAHVANGTPSSGP